LAGLIANVLEDVPAELTLRDWLNEVERELSA